MKRQTKPRMPHIGIVTTIISATSVFASDLAWDSALDPAYASGGYVQLNGGYGFAMWNSRSGCCGNAGSFLGSSTTNGGGSGGIDSGGKSFGSYANQGAVWHLTRPLTGGVLSVGQTFSVDFDNGFVEPGGMVGVALRNADEESVLEFYLKGSSAASYCRLDNDGEQAIAGLPFTVDGLHLEFTLTSPTTYSASITQLNGGASMVSYTGTLAYPVGGQGIAQFLFFNHNSGGNFAGPEWNSFVNNLQITVNDSDGDGVPDAVDLCPDTPPGEIVNADGCSISQLVPCAGPRTGGKWRNHGEYVRNVAMVAEDFRWAGLITGKQKSAIISQAARSRCGMR